jgi:hypothetical protein
MFAAALIAAGAGHAVRLAAAGLHPVPMALLVTATFGVVYFALARVFGLTEAQVVMNALLRRVGGRRTG